VSLILNLDLKQLRHVVLKCINRRPWKDFCEVDFIRQQRAKNRVFSLEDLDKWSRYKDLIDFLEELFNTKKLAIMKLDKLVYCTSLNIYRPLTIKAPIYITA
jgi:hypothetical protein